MCLKYTLWKKYLLFTILKRTIQKSEHVEEVAAMLDCHPSTFVHECHIADEDSSNLAGPLDIHGWTFYLAIWAVIHGQCSFWNFE